MLRRRMFSVVIGIASLLSAGSAMALTCGQNTAPTRLFTLDPDSQVLQCFTGAKNPKEEHILGYYPGSTWTKLGDITADGDNSALLNITITSGAWGSSAAGGTWTLLPSFWATYGDAVITMHVGNGNPEHAAFLLADLATGGTWNYVNNQDGGGFSNFMLWGRGPAICTSPTLPGCGPQDQRVPEPGTLALLGLGLLGLGAARRRVRR